MNKKKKPSIERCQKAILFQKDSVPKDIEEHQTRLGYFLHKQNKFMIKIDHEATLLNLSKNKLKTLETIKPENYLEDYWDKYFYTYEKIEYSTALLDEEIICNFLFNKFSEKYDNFVALDKINQIKKILEE